MYCTVKEIIRDVLDTDVPDSECVFAVVLTRGDVRHMAQDWNLSDDELETVMQRLDDAFVYGACDRVVSDIVNELMEEKRVNLNQMFCDINANRCIFHLWSLQSEGTLCIPYWAQ
ncbi:hypothetical protein PO463_24795 [Escherichia coli]